MNSRHLSQSEGHVCHEFVTFIYGKGSRVSQIRDTYLASVKGGCKIAGMM